MTETGETAFRRESNQSSEFNQAGCENGGAEEECYSGLGLLMG